MGMSQIVSKSTGHALYDTESKKTLVLVTKLTDAQDIQLPEDHDATVEKERNGEVSQELKYFFSIPVKAVTRNYRTGQISGVMWGKVDRDALAEAFPGIVRPMPRASNHRDR